MIRIPIDGGILQAADAVGLWDVDILADQVIGGASADIADVELHGGAEDVRERLVRCARLFFIDQIGGFLCEPMADLVCGDVDRYQRPELYAIAIAVDHRRASPASVGEVAPIVDVADHAVAVAVNAAPSVYVQEVVPGLRGTELRIDRSALAVGCYTRAPDVIGIAEDGPAAGGSVLQIDRVHTATGEVAEIVGAAAKIGRQRDLTAVQAVAGAGCAGKMWFAEALVRHAIVVVGDVTVAGVDEVPVVCRCVGAILNFERYLVGQDILFFQRKNQQLGGWR